MAATSVLYVEKGKDTFGSPFAPVRLINAAIQRIVLCTTH
jgi:hypothetical protein